MRLVRAHREPWARSCASWREQPPEVVVEHRRGRGRELRRRWGDEEDGDDLKRGGDESDGGGRGWRRRRREWRGRNPSLGGEEMCRERAKEETRFGTSGSGLASRSRAVAV